MLNNINGKKLTSDQLRYLLFRALWKNTLNADLNTPEGCEQAATVVTDFIEACSYRGYRFY